MKHSLLFTTIRPENVVQVLTRWTRLADDPGKIQWCITTDAPFADAVQTELAAAIRFLDIRDLRFDVVPSPPFTCNRAWNLGAKLSDGDLLYMVPDDIYPPAHWDTAIEKLIVEDAASRQYRPHGFVIHTDEGRPGAPLTHPIVSRSWYDRFGYFLYPNYMSMFDDTELAVRAVELDAVIDARYLRFFHRHWVIGARPKDKIDELQSGDERMEASKRLFDWRRVRGWPEPSFEAPQRLDDYAAYLQVNRDDFCLRETCEAQFREGVRRFFFHFQLRGWDGSFASLEHFREVERIATAMRAKGCDVVVERNCMAPHAGEERIMLETRVRNAALHSMRARGWKFNLLVDGDEVWRRGSLSKLHEVARTGWQVIATHAVTVAGLPGYAVESKMYGGVYYGPDAELTWCRLANIQAYVMPEPLYFHFTATRGTMEEIRRKHLASGHADDPKFSMAKWNSEVLPKIRPGMRNLHMYADGSGWPEARDFTADEWREIPPRLRRFMGKPLIRRSLQHKARVAAK